MSRTAEDLKAAVRLLEKYGWIQGRLGGAKTGFCSIGAINAATSRNYFAADDKRFDPVQFVYRHRAACRALIEAAEIPFGQVADWNDDPERTKDEVLEAFRRAIEAEEAGS